MTDDIERCQECGEVIDFAEVQEYHKTPNDEKFWHGRCFDAGVDR